MRELFKTVNDILKQNGVSMRSFAKDMETDRSLLVKMLNGTRGMSVTQFEKMLSLLNVGKDREETVREAYMIDHVGDYDLDTYRRFVSYIASLHNEKNNPSVSVQISIDRSEPVFRLETKHETAIMMEYILQNELKKAPQERRLYTNMPPNAMRSICKKYPQTKDCGTWDFRYVLDSAEKNNHGPDFLSCMIELLLIGYGASYAEQTAAERESNVLYRYLMVSSDCVLMTDPDCCSGFMQINAPLADTVAGHFVGKYTGLKPVMTPVLDVTSLSDIYRPFFDSDNAEFQTIENFCCVSPYLTREIWEEIARDTIPDRRDLLDFGCDYYSLFLRSMKKRTMIFSRQGLDRFAETGILETIPTEYVRPLPPARRVELLERMLADLTAEGNGFCLFDENRHMKAGSCCIEIVTAEASDPVMVVSTCIDSMPLHYVGNFSLFFYEPETIKGFLKYVNCMPASLYCMRQDESERYFRHTIEKLKSGLL